MLPDAVVRLYECPEVALSFDVEADDAGLLYKAGVLLVVALGFTALGFEPVTVVGLGVPAAVPGFLLAVAAVVPSVLPVVLPAGVLLTVSAGTFAVTFVADVLAVVALPVAVLPVATVLPGLVVTALLVSVSALRPTVGLTLVPPLSVLPPAIILLAPV